MNPRPTHYQCVTLPLSYPGTATPPELPIQRSSSDPRALDLICLRKTATISTDVQSYRCGFVACPYEAGTVIVSDEQDTVSDAPTDRELRLISAPDVPHVISRTLLLSLS